MALQDRLAFLERHDNAIGSRPANRPPSHHSTFAPRRTTRGGMIVVGSRNELPELQIWRNSLFEFVMFYISRNPEKVRGPKRNTFSARMSKIVMLSSRFELSGSTSTGRLP